MNYAVLGTGMVGMAIAQKLVSLGHEVIMGSRDAHHPKAQAWAQDAGSLATHGTFAHAAAHSERIFNCTSGAASLDALTAAGPANLAGKIVIDLANPLDTSGGMPPTLSITGRDSLGERIQAALPASKVVKTLNTVNASLMVNPAKLSETHDIFVCGNDTAAKADVTALLKTFGWRSIVDLGDIRASRGLESYLPFWLTLWGALGTPDFNLRIVRNSPQS